MGVHVKRIEPNSFSVALKRIFAGAAEAECVSKVNEIGAFAWCETDRLPVVVYSPKPFVQRLQG